MAKVKLIHRTAEAPADEPWQISFGILRSRLGEEKQEPGAANAEPTSQTRPRGKGTKRQTTKR